jgi:hypothetical protein
LPSRWKSVIPAKPAILTQKHNQFEVSIAYEAYPFRMRLVAFKPTNYLLLRLAEKDGLLRCLAKRRPYPYLPGRKLFSFVVSLGVSL